MLVGLIQSAPDIIFGRVTAFILLLHPAQIVSLALCLLYCLWRLWAFNIRPLLRPHEPREYPYAIPFLGHGVAFFQNSNDLIEKALNYFGRTHEPFTIQVGPERIYIVTNPQDVSEVYRKPDTLDWSGHLNTILTNFGCTDDFIRLGRTKPGEGNVPLIPNDPINPRQLPLIAFIEKTYHKQLMPGAQMTIMSEIFIRSLHESTDPLRSSCFDLFKVKVPSGRTVLSLKKLCEYTLLHAGIDSFFGRELRQIDPDLVEKMVVFNKHSWMLFYGLPTYFAEAVKVPQRSLMKTFEAFTKLPEHERQSQSWGVQQILIAQENVGVDLQSRAAILLMILWA